MIDRIRLWWARYKLRRDCSHSWKPFRCFDESGSWTDWYCERCDEISDGWPDNI